MAEIDGKHIRGAVGQALDQGPEGGIALGGEEPDDAYEHGELLGEHLDLNVDIHETLGLTKETQEHQPA